LNEVFEGDGDILFTHACELGCEGIVSKRLGSLYRSGRSPHWLKIKNPKAPAVCPPSALVRQIEWVEEGKISGSS
jgi:ATP-dependent DNA ligase